MLARPHEAEDERNPLLERVSSSDRQRRTQTSSSEADGGLKQQGGAHAHKGTRTGRHAAAADRRRPRK